MVSWVSDSSHSNSYTVLICCFQEKALSQVGKCLDEELRISQSQVSVLRRAIRLLACSIRAFEPVRVDVASLVCRSICINVDWSPHEALPPAGTVPSTTFRRLLVNLQLHSLELLLEITPLFESFWTRHCVYRRCRFCYNLTLSLARSVAVCSEHFVISASLFALIGWSNPHIATVIRISAFTF